MSAIVYWLAVRLYATAIGAGAMVNPKAKLFVKGRKQLLSRIRYALIDERRPRIWMHCASLGEFEQGRPLLEKLRQQYSNHAFILTFFSPSGYEVRKDYDGADYVFYLPTDSVRHARMFLDAVKPSLCIFVKYEHWYFYLSGIAARHIPLLLVSAIFRKDQPFFKWYGNLHRRMLQCFTHIFVQDVGSERLLHNINIDDVSVAGDTRFDRVLSGKAETGGLEKANSFCNGRKILVAGSTWPEDEQLLLELLPRMPEDWKLVLVPHNVDTAHIETISKDFGAEAILWSRYDGSQRDKKVLVVDTVGVLLQLYSYADVAWIGGGFGKKGVHNVLEAAVYGIPVMHGPVYELYLEAKELLQAGGSVVAGNADAALKQLHDWQKDNYSYEQACMAAMRYVYGKTGATEKIMAYLEEKNWLKTA